MIPKRNTMNGTDYLPLKYALAVAIALHQVCCYQQTGGELLNWI